MPIITFLTIFVAFQVNSAIRHERRRILDNEIMDIPDFGEIEGETVLISSTNSGSRGKYVNRYIGIPYAIPPLDDLRFRRSSILESLSDIGINETYIANDSRVCPQASNDSARAPFETEDCLVLNIYTPYYTQAWRSLSGLPVIVFIHGGSSTSLAGINFNGGNFVALSKKPVVFVTINYRLGPLGFMASEAIIEESEEDLDDPSSDNGGGHGVGDIIVALQWIQEHIEVFGGNADDVHLMGESAGGLLMSNFIVKNDRVPEGLFNKLIFVSSGAYRSIQGYDADVGIALYETLFDYVGLPSPNNLTALRNVPSDELILTAYGGWQRPLRTTYLPSIDDYFQTPANASLDDQLESVTSSDEIYPTEILYTFLKLDSFAAALFVDTPDDFETYFLSFGLDEATVDLLLSYYPEDEYNGDRERFYAMNADACFVCSTFDSLELLSQYVPQYGVQILGPTDNDTNLVHAEETKFIFNDEDIGPIEIDFDENYNKNLINLLSNFVYSSNTDADNSYNSWVRRWFSDRNELTLENYSKNRTVTQFGPQIDNRKTDFENVGDFFDTFRNGACHFWDQIADTSVLLRNLICLG